MDCCRAVDRSRRIGDQPRSLSRLPDRREVQEKADSKKETVLAKNAADQPVTIQGKTIDEWLAALKDRDPAVRERAVEILGERALDPAVPPDEQVEAANGGDVAGVLGQERAGPAGRRILLRSPEDCRAPPRRVKQALQERKKTVRPTRMPIRLVDAQGRPMKGAVVSTNFQRDADRDPSFRFHEGAESATSDARGELALNLAIPSHLDAAGIYAIRQDGDLPDRRPATGVARRRFLTASR